MSAATATKAPHTVDLDEMLEWIADEKDSLVIYASSSSEPKRLYVRLANGYRVTHGDVVVYEGNDGRSAVNAYNEIR